MKPAAAWLALAGLCAVLASCASERPRIEDYLPRAPLPQHAPAHAAEPPARPLTLDAAVRIALDNNPLLRAAREGVAAAREAVGEARAPYFPRISGIGGFGRLEAHDLVVTGTRGIDIGPDNSYTFLGILTWDIYDFGYRHAQLKAAMARATAAGEEAARARQDIALNVSLAFHTLRAADENLDAAKRAAERAEDHVRLARERQAVGAAPEADVLRARVEAGNARLELVRAHSQVRLARGDLNTAMGLPVELPVDVAAPAEEILAPDQVDLTAAFDRALYNRPELRRQLARVDEARRSADAARASLYPRLTLDAFYLQQGQTFFPEGRAWLYGAFIQYPLFEGFATRRRLSRSKAELRQAEAEAADAVLQVRSEVWTTLQQLREAWEAVAAAALLVEDSNESLRIAVERYSVQAGTVTELLDAQAALVRAEASLIRARADYRSASARLLRAQGILPVE